MHRILIHVLRLYKNSDSAKYSKTPSANVLDVVDEDFYKYGADFIGHSLPQMIYRWWGDERNHLGFQSYVKNENLLLSIG